MRKQFILASNGRPGPVWIDIPIDVQATSVKTNDLINFNKDDADTFLKDDDVSENTKLEFRIESTFEVKRKVRKLIEKLNRSKRPVILAGSGVKLRIRKRI